MIVFTASMVESQVLYSTFATAEIHIVNVVIQFYYFHCKIVVCDTNWKPEREFLVASYLLKKLQSYAEPQS